MTGFTETESGFRFTNQMQFFTESEINFTMKPNPDSTIEYPKSHL